MSSIPVKKGGSVLRRKSSSETVRRDPSEKNGSDTRGAWKHSGKENVPKPLVRQGSKKELEEENKRLQELIVTHENKIKELECSVNLKEAELTQATNKADNIKETFEKRLLTSNIDPVTMEKISSNLEEENEIQMCKEKTKVHVEALKKTMQEFNTWASTCITDIKEISSQLDSTADSLSS